MRTVTSLLAVLALFAETASSTSPTPQLLRSVSVKEGATEQAAVRSPSRSGDSQIEMTQNRLPAARKTPPMPQEGDKATPTPTTTPDGSPHTRRTPVPS